MAAVAVGGVVVVAVGATVAAVVGVAVGGAVGLVVAVGVTVAVAMKPEELKKQHEIAVRALVEAEFILRNDTFDDRVQNALFTLRDALDQIDTGIIDP